MKINGKIFRRTRSVTCLPTRSTDPTGQAFYGYVRFGKVCKSSAVGAEPTGVYRHVEGGGREHLWAIPIPICGYSATNIAYGVDGRMYAMLDGKFYVCAKPATALENEELSHGKEEGSKKRGESEGD